MSILHLIRHWQRRRRLTRVRNLRLQKIAAQALPGGATEIQARLDHDQDTVRAIADQFMEMAKDYGAQSFLEMQLVDHSGNRVSVLIQKHASATETPAAKSYRVERALAWVYAMSAMGDERELAKLPSFCRRVLDGATPEQAQAQMMVKPPVRPFQAAA